MELGCLANQKRRPDEPLHGPSQGIRHSGTHVAPLEPRFGWGAIMTRCLQ